MSDMTVDGHINPQEILRDENRTCTRKLGRVTGLVCLLAFLGVALTSTRVPAFAVPAQEWVQVMVALGAAKTMSGLGALWDGLVAAFGWLEMLGPLLTLMFKGIGAVIGAVIMVGVWIYDLVLSISPFSGATIDLGDTRPEPYRMGVLALWAPFAVLMLIGILLNKVRGKQRDTTALFLLLFSWVALGTDICGYWLFHINNTLGYERAGVFKVLMTGVFSFAVILCVGIYWGRYLYKLKEVFGRLNLRVEEPDWVEGSRIGILVSTPLMLMAGAYLGAFYGGTFTGAVVGTLLAATAYAWCVKSTLTCGYYPKSDFVVIPKREEPMLEHESVPALEGRSRRPVIDF